MRTRNPIHLRQRLRMLAASTCALALFAPLAHAETAEGTLEHGAGFSALWFVSPESGDLVGHLFHNASPAGQTILANCLPGLHCEVAGVALIEVPEAQAQSLNFSLQPSGWWLIEQAPNTDMTARMTDSLPMREQTVQTRFGPLSVQDQQLVFQGKPVMAPPDLADLTNPAAAPASAPASAPPSTEPATGWRARLSQWLDGLLHRLRQRIAHLFGSSSDSQTANTAPSSEGTPASTRVASATSPVNPPEPVAGNNALHIVAHAERQSSDLVLLQNLGGTACPALYRIATISSAGIRVTPEFGSCSDIAALAWPDAEHPDAQAPKAEWVLAMPGYRGPFSTPEEQTHASHQLHRYAFEQGAVRQVMP